MTITLNADYDVTLNTALLGYVGETNARPVSVEGLTVDGADRYVLTIDYGDGVQYEVDITGGQWTPTADILRSAQTVSCQIAAKKLSGDEYILVKKSRIFRLRIGAAIGDTAIPSPSVAADALDKIDAIGRQAHADMQTAVTAAETATTAAENAEKSATTAGVSADTATQAASRAETAKTAAETSATQAETAKQGAETARAEAVKSQNDAKVSAAQASTAAQQVEADKTITAGYAKTAKTNADSTAADRQAVQTLAEQVTADKTTVAENATKVAEDRTAAETAAQTAQAVADSLPDDYVTAVGKIAENTAEIANVKLADKELQRRVNALYDMGNGVTHKFETDTDTAYQKAVPTGAKLMSVKSVGGRSFVWNQMCSTFTYQGTECNCKPVYSAHKYLCRIDCEAEQGTTVYMYFREVIYTKNNQTSKAVNAGKSTLSWITSPYGDSDIGGTFDAFLIGNSVKVTFSNRQIFDLTAMFGSGNEPASVEEFEKIFPADYYPYNAGEIISAGTEEIVEQGANLCDPTIFSAAYPEFITVKDNIIDVFSGGQAMFGTGVALKIPQGYSMTFTPVSKGNMATNGRIRALFSDGDSSDIAFITDGNSLLKSTTTYVVKKDISAIAFNWSDFKGGYAFKMQITQNATDSFIPYHQTAYQIPEAIRNLPGYGWSAGTARNYVDYENKKYVQCVSSVDLGTLDWEFNTTSAVGHHFYAPAKHLNFKYLGVFGTTVYNALCSKYRTVARSSNVFVDKTLTIDGVTVVSQIQVKDTAYPDATAFKKAMQGVILYYELETPIVTDISDLLTEDFLRNVEVEAGGSITFKNSNDSYRIPVPSEEEYIIKLSEVGGSV